MKKIILSLSILFLITGNVFSAGSSSSDDNAKTKSNYEKAVTHIKAAKKHEKKGKLEKANKRKVILNVNFPKLSKGKNYKGAKICIQAKSYWKENFDKRQNPNGRKYYWLTGKFINLDKRKNTDQWALKNGYISVVPIMYDMTSYSDIDEIKNWNINV